MFTREQLIASVSTPDEHYQDLLLVAEELGFDVSQWRGSGDTGVVDQVSLVHMILQAKSVGDARAVAILRQLAKEQNYDTASRDTLRIMAPSRYGFHPFEAVKTVRTVRFDNSNLTSRTLTGSDIVVGNGDRSILYRLQNTVVVPAGDFVEAEVEAEVSGTTGNIPDGEITTLVNSIAGISVSSTPPDGIDTWIVREGSDGQSLASIRRSCEQVWLTRSPFTPPGGYEFLARQAKSPSGDPVGATKVRARNNPSNHREGEIYIANDSSTATATQVSDTQLFIDDIYRDRIDAPNVTIYPAVEKPLTIGYTLVVERSSAASAQVAIEDGMREYVESLQVGGERLTGTQGFVVTHSMTAVTDDIPGVIDFTLSGDRNIPIDDIEVAVVSSFNPIIIER